MTEIAEKDKDTKAKILEAANVLFAKHGFGSTSIRDIASKACVNLSAVNYHFDNKGNLYWKVFDYNYEKISLAVKQISETSENVEDMAVKFLEFFIEDGTTIMNTMKIFLSDNDEVPAEGLAIDRPKEFGPPGQKFFLEKLKKEIPESVSEEDCKWVVNTIFCLTCHIGMFLNTNLAKKRYKDKPEFNHEHRKSELRRSARLHVEHLKKSC
jgi:hypothetical protein